MTHHRTTSRRVLLRHSLTVELLDYLMLVLAVINACDRGFGSWQWVIESISCSQLQPMFNDLLTWLRHFTVIFVASLCLNCGLHYAMNGSAVDIQLNFKFFFSVAVDHVLRTCSGEEPFTMTCPGNGSLWFTSFSHTQFHDLLVKIWFFVPYLDMCVALVTCPVVEGAEKVGILSYASPLRYI